MRLPWKSYKAAILSARKSLFKDGKLTIVVENHPQPTSKETYLTLTTYDETGIEEEIAQVLVDFIALCNELELEIKVDVLIFESESVPVKILAKESASMVFGRTISK